MGRETGIVSCYWKDGWLYADGGHAMSVEVAAPDLPPRPFDPLPERDTFEVGLPVHY